MTTKDIKIENIIKKKKFRGFFAIEITKIE
jgi:hypothetical protein